MKIVVIGGQARKIGKTSVAVGLIRGLRSLQWIAVKISAHHAGIPHSEGHDGNSGVNVDAVLTEEGIPSAFTDTGRFLAAGARRAFWLRVKSGGLPRAVASLFQSLAGDQPVIIESGSAMNLIKHKVGILVLDRTRREMKINMRHAIARAAAVVEIAPGGRTPRRPLRLPPRVRRFGVTRKNYSNPKLNQFVLHELLRLENSQHAEPHPIVETVDRERNCYALTERS